MKYRKNHNGDPVVVASRAETHPVRAVDLRLLAPSWLPGGMAGRLRARRRDHRLAGHCRRTNRRRSSHDAGKGASTLRLYDIVVRVEKPESTSCGLVRDSVGRASRADNAMPRGALGSSRDVVGASWRNRVRQASFLFLVPWTRVLRRRHEGRLTNDSRVLGGGHGTSKLDNDVNRGKRCRSRGSNGRRGGETKAHRCPGTRRCKSLRTEPPCYRLHKTCPRNVHRVLNAQLAQLQINCNNLLHSLTSESNKSASA